jgi:monovalent cation:H+ antiporter-2, CPA2 family
MSHLPPLVSDLTLILVTAGIVALLCRFLKQPIVLGYLFSGFLIGTRLSDHESVKVWADLGVIFLLFGMGLEFSFRKLFQVGGSAVLIALGEVSFLIAGSYWFARLGLGWSPLESIFAGGVFSISSTAIIYRSFEELGIQNRKSSKIVLGVLVIEDLVAVLLLVVFTALTAAGKFQGTALVDSVFRLGFFLTFWFTFGIFLIPTFLKSVRSHLNSEMLLVVGLSLCLAMAWIATEAGFSAALGAFVMGSLLAETKERERIYQLSKPIRQLFSAIFFVSVGMLINPQVIQEDWGAILGFSALVLVIKPVASFFGALLSGQDFRTSLQTGLTLSQIGEFSFIIAALGGAMGGHAAKLYPIAVAVSALTTFTTPHFIQSSEKLYVLFHRRLSDRFKDALFRYQSQIQVVRAEKEWQTILLRILAYTGMNLSVVVAIGLFGRRWLRAKLEGWLEADWLAAPLGIAICLSLSGPFLWALATGGIRSDKLKTWRDGLRYRFAFFAIQMGRAALALVLVAYLVSQFIPLKWGVGVVFLCLLVGLIIISRKMGEVYNWFEKKFQDNWTDQHRSQVQADHLKKRIPFEMTLSQVKVNPLFRRLGETLQSLGIREKYGLSIVTIQRGQRKIVAPTRDDRLMSEDLLSVIGLESSIHAFEKWMNEEIFPATDLDIGTSRLFPIRLTEGSQMIGKTIEGADIRGTYKGIVIGVERDGEALLNPESKLALKAGDLLWLMGEG